MFWSFGYEARRILAPQPGIKPTHLSLEGQVLSTPLISSLGLPGTAEPVGLLSMGSHRVGHDWSDLAAAAAGDSNEQKVLSHGSIRLRPRVTATTWGISVKNHRRLKHRKFRPCQL